MLRVRCIVCSLGRDGENWCLALITRTPAEGSSRHSKKLYRRIEREYGYAYAAVAPHDGALVSLVLPEVNAGLMSLFLAEVGRRYPHEFVLMVLDGAGWHKAGDLVVPVQMRLEWLPARSPELNPAEHVWEELRESGSAAGYLRAKQRWTGKSQPAWQHWRRTLRGSPP